MQGLDILVLPIQGREKGMLGNTLLYRELSGLLDRSL